MPLSLSLKHLPLLNRGVRAVYRTPVDMTPVKTDDLLTPRDTWIIHRQPRQLVPLEDFAENLGRHFAVCKQARGTGGRAGAVHVSISLSHLSTRSFITALPQLLTETPLRYRLSPLIILLY